VLSARTHTTGAGEANGVFGLRGLSGSPVRVVFGWALRRRALHPPATDSAASVHYASITLAGDSVGRLPSSLCGSAGGCLQLTPCGVGGGGWQLLGSM
jgi:hypothetical protein